jgi:hypothetical protein
MDVQSHSANAPSTVGPFPLDRDFNGNVVRREDSISFYILIKSKNDNSGIKGSERNCMNEKILVLKSFRSSLTTTRNVNRISSVASNLPVL